MEIIGQAGLDIFPQFPSDFGRRLDHGTSAAMLASGTTGGRHYGDAAGRSMISSFTSHARRAALLAGGIIAAGVGAAGYAAFNLGKSSLEEAYEAQKVGALTTQVIKTTGEAANVTAREVGDLAEQLSNKTGVDDEIIQRGANMLLTFKNIRNEVGQNNDIFSQSVAITEDMAASMAGGQSGNNLDLKSASIQVGKALNDPVKGLTALSKVGVSFTDQQKKTIESLVEQNKVSEAQKIILGELQSEFGGAAAAQATLGEKVDVAWGNIQERIGTTLLPLVHQVQRAFLREGVPALERFSDWFRKDGIPAVRDFVSDAKPKVLDFIDDMRPLAEEVIPAVSGALGDVRDILGDAAPYAKDLVGAFNDLPDWAKKGAVIGGLSAYAGGKAGLFSGSGPGGGLLGMVSKSSPLPVYVVNSLPGGGVGGVGGGRGPLLTPGGAPARNPINGIPGGLLGLGFLMGGVTLGSQGATNQPSLWDKLTGASDPNAGSIVEPDGTRLKFMTEEMERYRTELQRTADDFASLPSDLRFRIITEGAPESRREARQLAETFDLTAKDRTTLFRTSGIPTARDDSKHLLDLYRQMNGTFTGDVNVNTGDAEARLSRILSLANAVNRLGGLEAAGAIPQGTAPSPRRVGGRTERRHTKVIIGEREFDAIIEERISTNDDLGSERRRAGARP